jgi:hypothetical protein
MDDQVIKKGITWADAGRGSDQDAERFFYTRPTRVMTQI